MKSARQQELVEQHLKSGASITGLRALKLYGCYRLSSVINRLRKKGMNIQTVKHVGDNFAEYYLADETMPKNPVTSLLKALAKKFCGCKKCGGDDE